MLLIVGLPWCLGRADAVPVTGKVLGPDGKPIAGAQVFVEDRPVAGLTSQQPRVRELATDGNGIFTADVETNRANATNLGDAVIYAHSFALQGIVLKPGDNTIRLSPGISVSGTVRDTANKPVADATVKFIGAYDEESGSNESLWFIPQLQAIYAAKSGPNGRWSIPDVPSRGNASVELDDPRFVTRYVNIELTENPAAAPPFKAEPGSIIIGKVSYPDGKPAAGLDVMATSEGRPNGYSRGKTVADGGYQLSGVTAGTYRVTATDSSGNWVATGIDHIATNVAQPTQAPPIIMGRGLLVEGSVVDAETKAPVQGASVSAQGLFGSSVSTLSDAQGHYKVRVTAGDITVYAYSAGEGYINGGQAKAAIINEGTKIPAVAMMKALAMHGTAVDETGKPATDAVLYSGWNQFGADNGRVDVRGDWKILGIRKGEPIQLNVRGAWQIVKPQGAVAPTDAPIAVTLRHIQLIMLRGRAVTPGGQPVAGASIEASISLSENGGRRFRRTGTDADGRFSLNSLRPEQKVSLTAKADGYKFKIGGEVQTVNGAMTVSDLVLAPLTSVLKGQVVDSAGKPVAGARILCPEYQSSEPVLSDAGGHFVVPSVAEGETKVMAANGIEWAQSRAQAGNDAPETTLRLADGKQDQIVGIGPIAALVEGWVTAANKTRDFQASQAVLEIAAVDPDRALELVTRDDGTATVGAQCQIMDKLIEADPQTAADWIPPRLDGLKDKQMQLSIIMDLGLAVADAQPDVAEAMYRRAKAAMNPRDYSQAAVYSFARMAALAAKLKHPEANSLMQAAMAALDRSVDPKQKPGVLGGIGGNVTYVDPALMGQILAELDDVLAPLDGLGKMRALESVVLGMAHSNPAAAQTLYAKMKQIMQTLDADSAGPPNPEQEYMYRPTPRQSLSRAAQSLARALAPIDIAKAEEVAKDVDAYQRGEILVAIAKYAKGDAAISLYRQAVEKTQQPAREALIARVAALVYKTDPKLGAEFFEDARNRVAQAMENQNGANMWESYAEYAFYHAPIDPAASRLLLEAELQSRLDAKPAANDYNYLSAIAKIAEAMAAIDANRALEILKLIPADQWFAQRAQSNVIHYMLATEVERSTMAFPQQ